MGKMARQKDVRGDSMVGNMTCRCYRSRGDPLGLKMKAP